MFLFSSIFTLIGHKYFQSLCSFLYFSKHGDYVQNSENSFGKNDTWKIVTGTLTLTIGRKLYFFNFKTVTL